jgi:osmotically-inducible protein OsmY
VSETADEPKQYVVGRLREALATDPRVNEMDLQVQVSGRKVFITGNVQTQERKEQISHVAREMCPEHEVHNQTTVREYPEMEEVEELT